MLTVKSSAPPAQQRFVDKALHLRSAALQHRPARRSVAAIATTRNGRRRPCAPIAVPQLTASALPRVVSDSVRPLMPAPTLPRTTSRTTKPTLLRSCRVRHMQEPTWHTLTGTRSQAVLRRSMAESCSYAAKTQPDVSKLASCGGTNTASKCVAWECA
jgi:hypothetical protein